MLRQHPARKNLSLFYKRFGISIKHLREDYSLTDEEILGLMDFCFSVVWKNTEDLDPLWPTYMGQHVRTYQRLAEKANKVGLPIEELVV